MEIYKEFTVEAAHLLPNVPEGHKCKRLHGHSFLIRIYVSGDAPEPSGWVMDFSELKRICNPYIEELDHSYLNEINGLENPTSENIAIWLWNRLIGPLQNLSTITVMETCNSGCEYSG